MSAEFDITAPIPVVDTQPLPAVTTTELPHIPAPPARRPRPVRRHPSSTPWWGLAALAIALAPLALWAGVGPPRPWPGDSDDRPAVRPQAPDRGNVDVAKPPGAGAVPATAPLETDDELAVEATQTGTTTTGTVPPPTATSSRQRPATTTTTPAPASPAGDQPPPAPPPVDDDPPTTAPPDPAPDPCEPACTPDEPPPCPDNDGCTRPGDDPPTDPGTETAQAGEDRQT